MHVDLALFQGDDLLDRGEITVGSKHQTDIFKLFQARHRLAGDVADIVLDSFASSVGLKRVTLDMPVHESEDWEKIELGQFTVAFWCRVEA